MREGLLWYGYKAQERTTLVGSQRVNARRVQHGKKGLQVNVLPFKFTEDASGVMD